ncbi:MAG: hypothetical protein IIA61_03125 [Candidatus Marinimicrobia bacterium]|nr:hypothetical protein [Candidatus Neomarinimicrobiota bacterium]
MDTQFTLCLEQMESWFRLLEKSIPQPKKIPFLHSFVFRYKEKTLEQALIQKLARVVTGLHSARILLNCGFLQEQVAINRILEELQQDISFLAYARLRDGTTELQLRYLDAFYEEEFDIPENPVASTQKRPLIPRKKIIAYIARKETDMGISNPSYATELTRTLSKAYSGFVHGASPQIMNMYGGFPPQFQISGMLGTNHEQEHRSDLWNYFYRGLLSFNEVALVFEELKVAESISSYTISFEKAAGNVYTKDS